MILMICRWPHHFPLYHVVCWFWVVDDSDWSLLLLEASKYLLRHLFASTFVYKTVSSTQLWAVFWPKMNLVPYPSERKIKFKPIQLPIVSTIKTIAGVRDGVAGPRDQPSSSLQVRRPSKDRPQPLERRFLPLSSLPELPQRLRQEVDAPLQHFHPALVRSSQPPFPTPSPTCSNSKSDVRYSRRGVYYLDKHALPRCFSSPQWHIDPCRFYFSPRVSAYICVHFEKNFSTSLLLAWGFFLQNFSPFFAGCWLQQQQQQWRVRAAPCCC